MVSTCALALLISITLPGAASYPSGPPLSSCTDMFPVGHGSNAQNANGSQPPFSITVNSTVYHANDVIQVNLSSTQPWFFEGVFIQARSANCSNPMKDSPIGTFRTIVGEKLLSPINCLEKASSAIAHNQELNLTNIMFYWIAPSGSVGDVYLRGTFARNKALFWTNVFSGYIADASLTNLTKERCTPPAMTSQKTGNGNTLVISLSAIFLSLLFSFL
ncbi:hypothetical protein CHS0354_026755 [Potamilus streckersoni]|uniref:Reelin domain-containing protein n=1 Tax=Potamilus streckersoni TaxID=2493646 RepID=A0AAE0SBC6_9BIVA|nr:hypothetical protein CHS0354_026755 [Potamilus streckersoni]